MAKRSITTEFTEEDAGIETTLRPKFLKDYIGQEKVKGNLKIYIEAAKQKRRGFGPCAPVWTSGTWKNNACRHYRK